MILHLIQEYIDERFNELNSRRDISFRVLQTEILTGDIAELPLNNTNNYYQVFIDNINVSDEYESNIVMNATVRVEFSFMVTAKKYVDYQNYVNNYIWYIVNILNLNNQTYSSDNYTNMIISELNSISVTNGGRIESGYYRPTLEFNCLLLNQSYEDILTTENNLT